MTDIGLLAFMCQETHLCEISSHFLWIRYLFFFGVWVVLLLGVLLYSNNGTSQKSWIQVDRNRSKKNITFAYTQTQAHLKMIRQTDFFSPNICWVCHWMVSLQWFLLRSKTFTENQFSFRIFDLLHRKSYLFWLRNYMIECEKKVSCSAFNLNDAQFSSNIRSEFWESRALPLI